MIEMLQESLAISSGDSLRAWLLTGTSLSAVIGGGWAIFKFRDERRKDRQQRIDDRRKDRQQRVDELAQRKTELRWRQAQAAKALVDEMLDDPQARAAYQMLDSWSREFEIIAGRREVTTAERWLAALRTTPDTADALLEMFVRESFDSLFYYMAMLEHYVERQFVLFEDVLFPLDCNIGIMMEDREVYDVYLRQYGLDGTRCFLNRFTARGVAAA